MTWVDRLLEAAYTSPSGNRFVWDYEDVARAVDKKTAGFTFPDAEGTYVQDLGRSGFRYPLRIIFWGEDCDLDATDFENALLERGTGKLEHPRYGTVNVIPFGTISRRDDLKTAANQAILEVTFWETINLIYPISQTDPIGAITSAISEYNLANSEVLNENLSIDTAVERVTIRNQYQALVDQVQSGLKNIASAEDAVRSQFETVYDSINAGIDALVADPVTLAFQTAILIQTPARAATSITDRLAAYSNLASQIFAINDATKNSFYVNDTFASGSVSGSAVSLVNTQFTTKPEAISAAEMLLTQFSDLVEWRDASIEDLTLVDTGESYQKIQEVVSLTAGFLVEISFTLKQERRIVLDRNRTIIDLAGELYGSIDDQLDFLITSNDLSGSEILELPRGREIVYYI